MQSTSPTKHCSERACWLSVNAPDGDKGRPILALEGVVGKGIIIAAEGGDGPCPA